MKLGAIPEGYSLEMRLPTIQAMMTGIESLVFSPTDTGYRAAIHFEGIGFYDYVSISESEVENTPDEFRLATLCLRKLEVADTDKVLQAASSQALSKIQ